MERARRSFGALAAWVRVGLLPHKAAVRTRALVGGEAPLGATRSRDLVALDVLLALGLGRGGGLVGLGGLLVVGHRSGLLSPPGGRGALGAILCDASGCVNGSLH